MSSPHIFVSYSHKDEEWKDRLLPYLGILEQVENVEPWDDRKIGVGENWYRRIYEVLEKTSVAICLVSENFLASSFCQEEEMSFLLRERQKGDLEIFPILIRHCPWKLYPWLSKLQMLPRDGKSLVDDFEGREHLVFTELTEQAAAFIRDPSSRPRPKTTFDAPKLENISRLPETGSLLFGRRDELNLLDKAWGDENTNIVIFKAHGGVGKSTLVRVWTEQMAEDNYRGAEVVYAWSFYSQGTSERVTSADQFVAAALEFFGDPDPQKGSAWDRGERLADLVAKQRTLLLLDGMEPLQSGHDFDRGEIKDPALKTLLEGLAERNPGLCVISTREDVADLEGTIERVDLEKVSTVAGRALLRIGGVPGTDDELEALVENFGHHALALNLLAAYLKWPGARAVSEIPELDDIPEAKGKHARRVMAAFETLFGEGPELDLLRVLGLFDGPVEESVIRALLADPPINGLTNHLKRGGASAFADAQASLRRAKLLADESRHDPPRLDSHPLVREHFGEQLETGRPEAWRAGHERLFKHCQEVADYQPSTLVGLAPLYAAVAHGCAAGRYEEAFTGVYRARILRGQEFYSLHQLGAFGSDLAAVSSFFETPWSKVAAGLPEDVQAFLLNQAGAGLRALGRLREAAEPLEAGLEARIALKDLKNASSSVGNLSDLQLTRGELEAAMEYGRRAVEYAERSGDWEQRMVQRTTQADAEHQAGRPEAAEKLFREAERLQQEHQPQYPLLYALQGYRYCDLLLAQGQAAEAQRRGRKFFEWRLPSDSLLDIALDHLTLGRAALALGDLTEAAQHLDEAVDGLRAAGHQNYVPYGPLARANLHRRQGHFNLARRDLHEVEKIARRGEMRLFLTDFQIESARLALAESDPAAAREHLDKARQLVTETGYHRCDPDLDEIVLEATKREQYLTSRLKLGVTRGRQKLPSETEPKEDRMDWIGALGEMGKGLPGGQIVLGPLLKLRDEEARRRFNESIDERFKTGQEISEGILDQLAEHQERTRSLDASTEVMKTLLEEIASALREQRPRRAPMAVVTSAMKISRFPLPFGRELLFEELAELFQDEDDLEDLEECLLAAGLKGLDGRGRVAKLKRFLSRLTGQPRRKLEKLFCCLYTQREGSEILRHACEFWRRDGKRPQSSGGRDASAGEQ